MCKGCTCFYRILNPSIAIGRDALTAVTDYEQVVANVNLAMNLSQTANFTATLALQQVRPSSLMYAVCILALCPFSPNSSGSANIHNTIVMSLNIQNIVS